jgi:beta-phosphoglucomutase
MVASLSPSVMPLKAVLLDFNGTIINDEPIHRQLINELLLAENLRPASSNYRQICVGKSDQACLLELLAEQGRSIDELQLQKLLSKKTIAYQQKLAALTELPIYQDLVTFLDEAQSAGLQLGIVTGAIKSEVLAVLERTGLTDRFSTIIASEDVLTGKPAPDGYLLAAQQLQVQPQECLAIEDTFPGLLAAKAAHIPVVGIAHTYPFHMMQRLSNWAVDCFADLELQRIQYTYGE